MSKFHWSHWTSTRFEDFGWISMKFHVFTSFVLCSSLLLLCIIHLLYIYISIDMYIYNAYWCHRCPIQMPKPCFFVLRRSRYSWQPVENRWWQQLHCLHDSCMTAAWQHYKHLFVKEFPTHHMDTTWTPHAMAESCGICLQLEPPAFVSHASAKKFVHAWSLDFSRWQRDVKKCQKNKKSQFGVVGSCSCIKLLLTLKASKISRLQKGIRLEVPACLGMYRSRFGKCECQDQIGEDTGSPMLIILHTIEAVRNP